MENTTINYAVVGAGRAAQLHIDSLLKFNDIPVKLTTICDYQFEKGLEYQTKYGFSNVTTNFDDLINDVDIDVIDICTPPYLHEEMIKKSLLAGKHVICEKPLSGYFGSKDEKDIGNSVSKEYMYRELLSNLDEISTIVKKSEKKFMYAENFIYAPSIQKAAEVLRKKKSKIMFAKGEESLKGSSSPVAGLWNKTGGGTFIRTGAHPLSAILWLKSLEGKVRGEEIKVKSVMADFGRSTSRLSPYDHRHIEANPIDVEDTGAVILTFTDETKAVVMATDTLLGGSRNYVDLYCNDAVINCNITMSNLMSTYFLDEDRLDDVYISEMLPSKTGWNNVFLEDEILRGYVYEMHDFMECVLYNKEPISNFELAYDSIKIMYASYMSAELGKRIEIE